MIEGAIEDWIRKVRCSVFTSLWPRSFYVNSCSQMALKA